MGKLATIVILAAVLTTFDSGDGIAAQPNSLTKFLNQMDRNICRSYKMTCKTRAKPSTIKRQKPAEIPSEDKATTAKSASAPPIPVQKPVTEAKVAVLVEAKRAVVPEVSTQRPVIVPGPVAVMPIPRAKPQVLQKQAAIIPRVTPQDMPLDMPLDDNTTCLQKLRAAGAKFSVPAVNVDSGACHVENPVNLNSVISIELPEGPLLNCKFALQFTKWLKESGAPILSAQLGSPLKKIATGPGYECRGRNGDSSAKISEHGFGNAVDIATLHLQDGRVLNVEDAIQPNGANSAAWHGLRTSACGYFTTVLGPGSNAAHEKHFHFDLGVHGKSGNYRICE
jgi:hypothetical protein